MRVKMWAAFRRLIKQMLGVVWLSQRINNRCTNRSNNKNNNTNRSSHNLKYHRGRQNQQEHTWNIWKVIFLLRKIFLLSSLPMLPRQFLLYIFFFSIPPEILIFAWPVSYILSVTFVYACFTSQFIFPSIVIFVTIFSNFHNFSLDPSLLDGDSFPLHSHSIRIRFYYGEHFFLIMRLLFAFGSNHCLLRMSKWWRE